MYYCYIQISDKAPWAPRESVRKKLLQLSGAQISHRKNPNVPVRWHRQPASQPIQFQSWLSFNDLSVNCTMLKCQGTGTFCAVRPAPRSVLAAPFTSRCGRCEAARSLRYTDVITSTASSIRSLDTPIKLATQHVRDDQSVFVKMMTRHLNVFMARTPHEILICIQTN
jgi:hypothetical protein